MEKYGLLALTFDIFILFMFLGTKRKLLHLSKKSNFVRTFLNQSAAVREEARTSLKGPSNRSTMVDLEAVVGDLHLAVDFRYQ